jgi:nicotinamidase-related amidase
VVTDTILLDIDTQRDFIMPDGARTVPGAFGLNPSLERLTRYGRMYDLRVVATRQSLAASDPRFEPNGGSLPPHVVAGTPGADKVPATTMTAGVVVPARELPAGELQALLAANREIIVETSGPDLKSNPNAAALLVGVREAYVYGVAGEEAVRAAVDFLRDRGIGVHLVENAVALWAAEPEAREAFLAEMTGKGVQLARDLDVMTRFTTARHR